MMDAISTSFGMLRPWDAGDAPALAKYANNRKIWLNLRDGFPHPYTLDNAHAFLDAVSRQDPVTYLAIATPGEAIGSIGLTLNSDVHRLTAEMGYWLAEPFWGRGIMTEVIEKFVDFGFTRFGTSCPLFGFDT